MSASLRFPAPWSTGLKVMSAVCVVLMLLVSGLAGMMPGPTGVQRTLLLFLGPVGMLLAALFVVREYEVAPGQLSIRRLFWNTRIPLVPLVRVEVDPRALSGSIRIGGNGGFFSFTGWYYNRRLGRYRMLVTDLRRPVVLHFADRRPVVVSPGDPGAFAHVVRRCSGLPGE
jgi:hypothetical protein